MVWILVHVVVRFWCMPYGAAEWKGPADPLAMGSTPTIIFFYVCIMEVGHGSGPPEVARPPPIKYICYTVLVRASGGHGPSAIFNYNFFM